jgi:hypothetical protein
MSKREQRWQWMDNRFGGMGWFTAAEKEQHEGTSKFKDGWWRPVPADGVDEFNRYVGRLAYEQS